jgi:hypothetical protein
MFDAVVKDRVSVSRRLDDSVGPDHATAAGPVIDNDRLLQRDRQTLRHQARQRIDSGPADDATTI